MVDKDALPRKRMRRVGVLKDNDELDTMALSLKSQAPQL